IQLFPRRQMQPFSRGLSSSHDTTREAVHEIMTDSRWDGKTVVMVWEHHHIADSVLENAFTERVTLRQLLHLHAFGNLVLQTPTSYAARGRSWHNWARYLRAIFRMRSTCAHSKDDNYLYI